MFRPSALLQPLLLLLLGTAAAHAQRNPTAARFDRMADRLAGDGAAMEYPPYPSSGRARVVALWDTLDAVVLRELARKPSVAAANARLGKLHGYRSPTPGKGTTVGNVTFYGVLPREMPSYWLGALDSAGTLAIAAYELGPTVPGRVSAFARVDGRWRRVGRLQPSLPVKPFVVRTGPGSFGLLTVERFVGADRIDCFAKTWSLTSTGMRLVHATPGRLLDCSPEPTDTTVAIIFDRFPAGLSTGVLGVRLTSRRVFRAVGGRLAALPDEPVNPWAVVVDDYFASVSTDPPRARRLLEDPALALALRDAGPIASEDSGSVAGGTGQVIVRRMATREKDRFWAIRSRRGLDGAWRISAVVPTKDPHPAG